MIWSATVQWRGRSLVSMIVWAMEDLNEGESNRGLLVRATESMLSLLAIIKMNSALFHPRDGGTSAKIYGLP